MTELIDLVDNFLFSNLGQTNSETTMGMACQRDTKPLWF